MEAIDPAAGVIASWVGFAANTLLFSAQFPLMATMLRDKDADSRSRYSFVPAAGQYATTAFWLAYAVVALPVDSILAINAIGSSLALIYAAIFFYCRPTAKEKLLVATVFGAITAATVLVYGLSFGLRYESAKIVVSVTTVIVNVSLWATPLQALRLSVQERSLKRVSVPLSFVQVVAAASWTSAGFFIGDVVLVTTSLCGVVLTPIQLAVIAWVWWSNRTGSADSEAAPAEISDIEAVGLSASDALEKTTLTSDSDSTASSGSLSAIAGATRPEASEPQAQASGSSPAAAAGAEQV